jgi:hypothetical protein
MYPKYLLNFHEKISMEKVAMHAINPHMFVFQLFDVASIVSIPRKIEH